MTDITSLEAQETALLHMIADVQENPGGQVETEERLAELSAELDQVQRELTVRREMAQRAGKEGQLADAVIRLGQIQGELAAIRCEVRQTIRERT